MAPGRDRTRNIGLAYEIAKMFERHEYIIRTLLHATCFTEGVQWLFQRKL